MGRPMSDHLLAAGHAVLGFDPSAAAMLAHEEAGGEVSAAIEHIALAADIVITSLPGAAALVDVLACLGAGAARRTDRPPLVVVETSTLTLTQKRSAKETAGSLGIELLDCTVSGTSAQARNGDLVAYLSFDDVAAADRARGAISGFAREIHDVGEFGNGTKMKLVANTLVAIHNLAAAEALLLAERAGLDLELTLRAVGDGAGGSRMLQVRGPLMVSGEYEPATAKVEIFRKDMRAIRELAESVGSPMPLLAATSVYYEAAAAQGRGDHDAASIFAVLHDMATPPGTATPHDPKRNEETK